MLSLLSNFSDKYNACIHLAHTVHITDNGIEQVLFQLSDEVAVYAIYCAKIFWQQNIAHMSEIFEHLCNVQHQFSFLIGRPKRINLYLTFEVVSMTCISYLTSTPQWRLRKLVACSRRSDMTEWSQFIFLPVRPSNYFFMDDWRQIMHNSIEF